MKKITILFTLIFALLLTACGGEKEVTKETMDKKNDVKMTSGIDPELVAPLENFLEMTGGGVVPRDIPATRELLMKMFAGAPKIEGIISEDRQIPGPEGAPDVTVRIYRPETPTDAPLPAILWLHGGDYVLGNLETGEPWAGKLAKDLQSVVVAVDYRLAPEHPFPAGVEDSCAALKWVANNADELGIDNSRIAIGGESAGAGMTAGLALLTRDRNEVGVAFQLLVYPMLDDRNIAPAGGEVLDHYVMG